MTDPGRARWLTISEKGSLLGIRLLVAIATVLGRRAAGWVLRLVAAWFVLFHGPVRRASRGYLVRLHGRASLGDNIRHVFCFARVTLDRLFMARGDFGPFEITCRGEEHLRALRAANRGALILLAHIGSFEVMRALSEPIDLRVNVLGYFQNAPRINAALRQVNPKVDDRLIEIRPDDPTYIFEIEKRVGRGELLGIMGDRAGLDGKSVHVPFFGTHALFPTGPYRLAAALGCPVYLAFGIHHEPNRYALACEPFSERIELPAEGREEALASYASRYAARLEEHCREAPYNWFNFYDFWSEK
jgi:predicted LPLAT superfamily acyltransferase